MTELKDRLTPSLFEPQSRGGDIAEAGFSFQESILLIKVPSWLAQEGFTALIREAIGDTEAQFFHPRQGIRKELLEVKNHLVDFKEFWKEIKRFYAIQEGSPETYSHFSLVTTGVSEKIKPLLNGLKRLRDPENFYNDSPTIWNNSYKDYLEIIKRLGQDEKVAQFIFEKISIETDWSPAKIYGESLFIQSLVECFTEYELIPNRTLKNIFEGLSLLVRNRRNQPIKRKEIETIFKEELDSELIPSAKDIKFLTKAYTSSIPQTKALQFEWAPFFGGESRSYPPSEQWQNLLMKDLHRTQNWMLEHRSTRCIRLQGRRRLSASIAIGSIFSAVAGFSIEVEYRGEIWATNAHPTPEMQNYPIQAQSVDGESHQMVVTISILRNISSYVDATRSELGLTNMPTLHIQGSQAITSAEQANLIARNLKDLISSNISAYKIQVIHLFLATPAPLALFLGHRLNATAVVQCYEWIGANRYIPTCRIAT